MKAQLEQRLIELRTEYESGQKILKDIEAKLAELEKRKKNLSETLLRISGAIELLEEVLGKESKSSIEEESKSSIEEESISSIQEVPNKEIPEAESKKEEVEVPFVVRLPLEQAVKKLEEAGLRIGKIGEKSVFVGGVLFGDVIQQEPKGGVSIEKGSPVNLVVAKKGSFKPDMNQNSLLGSYSRH